MANRACKYRIYPDKQQEQKLAEFFGCVRFVYNKCLEEQERRFRNGEDYASRTEMNNYCNRVLKKEYPFLKRPDKFALTNAIFHLDDGYQRLFSHIGGYPKYKSKHRSRRSYTTNITNGNIAVLEKAVKLPKLGLIKAKIHRRVPEDYVLKSATISQEPDGSYYVSVLYEYEEHIEMTGPSGNWKAGGLDYKSDGLYVSSEGDVADMPHYYREAQPSLARSQRKLRHKVKGSANWRKQQKKTAKISRHIANQRKDFLHKKSAEIANQYDIVCVEDLDMRAMSNKGYGNGKATLDNGYGMFLNMLEYKLHDRGKKLVKIDKWYPSSQTCSCCGSRKEMPLAERTYRCPVCGMEMDRDRNAAINIRNEGLRLLGLVSA